MTQNTAFALARFIFVLLTVQGISAAAPLAVYQPTVKTSDIYFYNPASKPALRYNHDVDIVKFKGRFLAAWNANEARGEDVPGQYNYLSISDDFEHWSAPQRMFTAEAGASNPVESDNQWQPNFINWKDQSVFCAWSDFVARRVFVASSQDGTHWTNAEVANAPADLQGRACAFPTNHGLVTTNGVMLFPCSIPFTNTPRAKVGETRYAGVLRSGDGGKSWSWSQPIEAVAWSQLGENPAEFGGDTITLWEPMLFEQGDGSIGLLIRNSTAQEDQTRTDKSHRMLLYATSRDQGQTWTKARPVEVDTVCSRNYSVGGVGTRDSLMMVMNDNHARMPERMSYDRYFLSLYCSPVSDPDLLLPGPLIQPPGGRAFYPNGFVDHGKLYIGYSYPGGIHSSVVGPLPDFSAPFFLPRGGREGLLIADRIAHFTQRQDSLGLVLTEALTRQARLKLTFDVDVHQYDGREWPIITIGGKTHSGMVVRAVYNEAAKANIFEVSTNGKEWGNLGSLAMKEWNHFEVELLPTGFSVAVNKAPARTYDSALLRKICFGGLYLPPEWPRGKTQSGEVRVKLDSVSVQ